MRRLGLLAAAALAGIVLAVIAMPRPDTGDDIVVSAPATAVPAADPATPAPQAAPPPERAPSTANVARGPNPSVAKTQIQRATPESIYAGKATAPWTLIRRNLLRVKDPDATTLAQDTNALILDLRALRQDPEKGDYETLEGRQKGLTSRVRESPFFEDAEIRAALERLDGILADYHKNKNAP